MGRGGGLELGRLRSEPLQAAALRAQLRAEGEESVTGERLESRGRLEREGEGGGFCSF